MKSASALRTLVGTCIGAIALLATHPSPGSCQARPPIMLAQEAVPTAPVASPAATALTQFWKTLADQQYQSTWHLMSMRTQQVLADAIAKDAKLSSFQVMEMFKNNDPALQAGFWTEFRRTSNAPEIVRQTTWSASPAKAGQCSVQAIVNGKATVRVKMFLEGGGWKVGYVETFMPNGLP
jgi:hypothetical protein